MAAKTGTDPKAKIKESMNPEELNPEHNIEIAAVHHNYLRLQSEATRWLAEQGGNLTALLLPAASPPYFPSSQLPVVAAIELWTALNKITGLTLTSQELREMWQNFGDDRKTDNSANPNVLSNLWLARVALTRHARTQLTTEQKTEILDWQGEICPVCGQPASLTLLTPPVGKRFLYCTTCGHSWPGQRVGCIRCGSEDAQRQIHLQTAEFPGVEMVVCQDCSNYFKEFDLRKQMVEDLLWEDIRTLPLNYAAEQWLAQNAKQNRNIL